MFISLSLMVIGVVLGFILRNVPTIINIIDPLIRVVVCLLLFLLGISVGGNKTIINNMDTLGMQSLLLALGGVMGSALLAFFTYKLFFKRER